MISIIVPVYNVEPYVEKCLSSLDNQSFDDYEVIIINDGSTDHSYKICKKFADNNTKFFLYSKKNEGLMSAWLDGVKLAKGDYIGFVDSDDYIDPEMFSNMYNKAKEHNVDVVMCNRHTVYRNHIIEEKSSLQEGIYTDEDLVSLKKITLPTFNDAHITNARWNKIYKSKLFMENIVYCKSRSRICEDRYIVPACMFNAKSLYYIPKPYYYYVQRKVSNHSLPSTELYSTLKEIERIQKQMLIDSNQFEMYKSFFERARLNYLRINVNRNLLIDSSLVSKYKVCKELVCDKSYQESVIKYNSDLTGKLGKMIMVSYKLRSPMILALSSKLYWLFNSYIKKRKNVVNERL